MNQKYVFSFLCTVASYHCCHRMVHSFTCAGVLQTQYEKLSSFAGLGTLRNCYVRQGIHIRFCLHLQCMYKSFCTVYHQRSYMDLVSEAAEASMKAAVEEVHSLPHYASEGEVIKTQFILNHFLSLNSGLSLMQGMTQQQMPTIQRFHASLEGILVQSVPNTMPCLLFSTHRIVGISTISRTEHLVPQTREVACTKSVLPQVIARG